MIDFSSLPEWLQFSIQNYISGRDSTTADCLYCDLLYDLNFASENGLIDRDTDKFLRCEYLGIYRE